MQLAVGLAGREGLSWELCGKSGLRDAPGEQEVGLATERHKSDSDRKGVRHWLCGVGVRPGDTVSVRGMVMVVVGVCALMVGMGGWLLHGE